MNRDHVIGCPALRGGVRCVCQLERQRPRSEDQRELMRLRVQVRELTIEWHGVQDMARDQHKAIHRLVEKRERSVKLLRRYRMWLFNSRGRERGWWWSTPTLPPATEPEH